MRDAHAFRLLQGRITAALSIEGSGNGAILIIANLMVRRGALTNLDGNHRLLLRRIHEGSPLVAVFTAHVLSRQIPSSMNEKTRQSQTQACPEQDDCSSGSHDNKREKCNRCMYRFPPWSSTLHGTYCTHSRIAFYHD